MVPAQAQVSFRVSLPREVEGEVGAARALVYLIVDGALPPGTMPAYGPYLDVPQPIFSCPVDAGLRGGDSVVLAQDSAFFQTPMRNLPAGSYTAQAVIDRRQVDSRWWCEVGNFHSQVVSFTHDPASPTEVSLPCDQTVAEALFPQRFGVEEFIIKSEAVTNPDGSPMLFKVGVSKPVRFEPSQQYASVFEFPDFGMDHRAVFGAHTRRDAAAEETPAGQFARRAFWFTISPMGPNGYHYFLDSAINGDLRQALVFEIIGALEETYPLRREASSRLVTGTGAGAWAAWHACLTEPDTFGGCWAVAPAHFDLRSVYGVDLGVGVPADDSRTRTELEAEAFMGAGGTSGGRWDSLRCAWTPPGSGDGPVSLLGPGGAAAGPHDLGEYDLCSLVRGNPGELVLRMRERVRIILPAEHASDVRAMRELVAAMNEINFFHYPEGGHGYVKIVDGTRSSAAYLEALGGIFAEMNAALDRAEAKGKPMEGQR